MSKPLLRSRHPSGQFERYLQRCARQRIPFAPRDDLRPLLSSSPISLQRSQPRSQPFSTWPRQQAGGMRTSVPKVKQKAQPSMAAMREKERAQVMGRGQIPDDLGLMEGTFVMPLGKNRPSWAHSFRTRWKLEKARWWTRAGEWIQMFMFRYRQIEPRPKLHYRTAASVAKRMHKEMYEAFAAGDLRPVQAEVCTGLLTSLRSRIGQRPANTHLKWTLHEYLSAPKLVSYKSGILPGFDGQPVKDKGAQNGFTQAVIRIHSLQSLQHVRTSTVRQNNLLVKKEVIVDSQGRELPEEAEGQAKKNAKETVEYFVIQKQLKKSREGPWMVWGTAEETSLETVERGVRKRKQEKEARKAEKAAASGAA